MYDNIDDGFRNVENKSGRGITAEWRISRIIWIYVSKEIILNLYCINTVLVIPLHFFENLCMSYNIIKRKYDLARVIKKIFKYTTYTISSE